MNARKTSQLEDFWQLFLPRWFTLLWGQLVWTLRFAFGLRHTTEHTVNLVQPRRLCHIGCPVWFLWWINTCSPPLLCSDTDHLFPSSRGRAHGAPSSQGLWTMLGNSDPQSLPLHVAIFCESVGVRCPVSFLASPNADWPHLSPANGQRAGVGRGICPGTAHVEPLWKEMGRQEALWLIQGILGRWGTVLSAECRGHQ